MKLYAKTYTDKLATNPKTAGKGSNRDLIIDLLIDNDAREVCGRVVMNYDEHKKLYTIYYYPVTDRPNNGRGKARVLLYEKKERI